MRKPQPQQKKQSGEKHFINRLNIFSFFIAGLNVRYMIEANS